MTTTIGERVQMRDLALAATLLVGVVLRLAYVDRPFDYRLANPWQQSDYLAIARNFAREGMDIRNPRIDWRGDTPGFVEMELPVVPWVGAVIYRTIGPSVPAQRALSAGLSIAGLLLFALLAARLLPPAGARFATLVIAINPVLVELATTLQPEPLLDVCCLLSVLLLWRWSERPSGARLILVAAAVAAAILVKLPAAYLGLLFAAVVWQRLGWQALRTPAVYVAALVALLPPVAWYTWAHHFWRDYGASLALSNQSHFIGWDSLLPPTFLLGIALWETLAVFSPTGWLLALAALRLPWPRIELPALWYAAVMVFYVVAGRTTAEQWGYYYHALSAAPGALLMGGGIVALRDGWVLRRRDGAAVAAQRRFATTLGLATIVALVGSAALLIWRRDGDHGGGRLLYVCSQKFAAKVPSDARIVVRGDRKTDASGHPVAWNAPMVFAWMDRKGFNYPADDLSNQTLDAIAARGGRYWIATPVDTAPELDASRYRLLATCGDHEHVLYDLRPDLPPETP